MTEPTATSASARIAAHAAAHAAPPHAIIHFPKLAKIDSADYRRESHPVAP
jgi:hypothetical protein